MYIVKVTYKDRSYSCVEVATFEQAEERALRAMKNFQVAEIFSLTARYTSTLEVKCEYFDSLPKTSRTYNSNSDLGIHKNGTVN